MDIFQSKQYYKDEIRQFKFFTWLTVILFIDIVIGSIVRGVTWKDILVIPNSGLVTFLVFVTSLSPLIIAKIKFYYLYSKILFLSYSGKLLSFEKWKENKRIFSILNQQEIIAYYNVLRSVIDDDIIVRRITELIFLKGDKIEYLLLTLGDPDFLIHYHLWRFNDKLIFYYFPYYEKKSILNFFRIKFKYTFTFVHDELFEFKIDGLDQF
jgi:hypothetical protein